MTKGGLCNDHWTRQHFFPFSLAFLGNSLVWLRTCSQRVTVYDRSVGTRSLLPARKTHHALPGSSQLRRIALYQQRPYHFASADTGHGGGLHGLQPPDPKDCRVLELGCGRGGNLLPMGESLPASRFVGIDLSL